MRSAKRFGVRAACRRFRGGPPRARSRPPLRFSRWDDVEYTSPKMSVQCEETVSRGGAEARRRGGGGRGEFFISLLRDPSYAPTRSPRETGFSLDTHFRGAVLSAESLRIRPAPPTVKDLPRRTDSISSQPPTTRLR